MYLRSLLKYLLKLQKINAPLLQVDTILKGRDVDIINTLIAHTALFTLINYYPSLKINNDIIDANCGANTTCRCEEVPIDQIV